MLDHAKSWARRLALNSLIGAAVALGTFVSYADAQISAQQITALVVPVPGFVTPNPGVTDLGNGPFTMRVVVGNGRFSTSSGSGVAAGSAAAGGPAYTGQGVLTVVGSSTSIILNSTPLTPPCVGCLISAGANPSLTSIVISPWAFVAAYSGTQITMSTNVTIGAQTPLAWGAACPTTPGAVLPVQASVGGDVPFYTLARVCGYGTNGPGASVVTFPFGAH